jgi:uncharacterized membrane protein
LCFKKQLFLQTAVIDTDVIQYKCLYLMDFLHCIFLVLFVLTSRFKKKTCSAVSEIFCFVGRH